MNSNAINIRQCTGCKQRKLCMRVLSVIETRVAMCYACITRAFDRRIEKELEELPEMLIPDDEEEGYSRQMMAEENERQMEAEQGK